MLDDPAFFIVAATFLLAGTVKGVVGFGLPTVSIALLALTLGLTEAMALLLVPSFAANLWQAVSGGGVRALATRIWPFLLLAGGTVWIGAAALTRVDATWLSALLGLLLLIYAAAGLAGFGFSLTRRQQAWAGPLFGAVNGVLTGMTGSFVVPGVFYLQAMGLPRDQLVQAMGMLFLVSTLALGAALTGQALMTAELGLYSAIGLVPAIAGMIAGQKIRRRLPEALFRRVLFAALLFLGAAIVARSLGGPL